MYRSELSEAVAVIQYNKIHAENVSTLLENQMLALVHLAVKAPSEIMTTQNFSSFWIIERLHVNNLKIV